MMDKCNFSLDKTLVVKSWSPDMETLCHRPAGEVIGNNIKNVFPLLHDKILPVFNNGRERRLKGVKHTCFMGTYLTADVRIIPLKNTKGDVIGAKVVLSNVAGKCPVTKKLADSEKMIAIGKTASTLAHGVRNPLNAIKGAVVYLREKYGHEATLLEFSTIIYDEINKLDNFISSFLSTAQGGTKFSPVDLNEVLGSILTMIKPKTEIQEIKLQVDLSDLPRINADPFQIEQAFFNIINNAIEAMPDGGAIIIKTYMKQETGNDYAVIEISDTGRGIPEKKARKLGELPDNPSRNDKGFGIFLSREIIKAHKGKLLWESRRQRGTTFKVFLPVQEIGQSG